MQRAQHDAQKAAQVEATLREQEAVSVTARPKQSCSEREQQEACTVHAKVEN